MSQNKWFRRAAGAALACASIVSIVSAQRTGCAGCIGRISRSGGEFHALTPTRILDTRPEMRINDVQPLGEAAVGKLGTTAGNSLQPARQGWSADRIRMILAIVATSP